MISTERIFLLVGGCSEMNVKCKMPAVAKVYTSLSVGKLVRLIACKLMGL